MGLAIAPGAPVAYKSERIAEFLQSLRALDHCRFHSFRPPDAGNVIPGEPVTLPRLKVNDSSTVASPGARTAGSPADV